MTFSPRICSRSAALCGLVLATMLATPAVVSASCGDYVIVGNRHAGEDHTATAGPGEQKTHASAGEAGEMDHMSAGHGVPGHCPCQGPSCGADPDGTIPIDMAPIVRIEPVRVHAALDTTARDLCSLRWRIQLSESDYSRAPHRLPLERPPRDAA